MAVSRKPVVGTTTPQIRTIRSGRKSHYPSCGNAFPRSYSRREVATITTMFLMVILIDLVHSLSLSSSSPSLSAAEHQQRPAVQIWDNVISKNNRNRIHTVAKTVGLGHSVLKRPITMTTTTTTTKHTTNHEYSYLERALDSILNEMNDTSPYVEYWTRQEWRSIEAHADIDEFLARQQPKHIRYPTNGHVLYLQLGTQVKGPTCIFPNRQSGGDLLVQPQEITTTTDDGNPPPPPTTTTTTNTKNEVEVIVVPAVEGRVLRFPGNWLHAVPRPTDLWLLKFVQGAPEYTPEEDYGRSVVLFNTWENEPPHDVPITNNNNHHTDDNKDTAKETTIENIETDETRICKEYSQWIQVPVHTNSMEGETCSSQEEEQKKASEEKPQNVKIWLLGDQQRRRHLMRTVNLQISNPNLLRDALFESHTVNSVLLNQP